MSNRRGRQAAEGADLANKVVASLINKETMSYHFRRKAAEEGLISFVAYRKPGQTKGKPFQLPVPTDKCLKLYQDAAVTQKAANAA